MENLKAKLIVGGITVLLSAYVVVLFLIVKYASEIAQLVVKAGGN